MDPAASLWRAWSTLIPRGRRLRDRSCAGPRASGKPAQPRGRRHAACPAPDRGTLRKVVRLRCVSVSATLCRPTLTSNDDRLFRARLRYTSLRKPPREPRRERIRSPSRLRLSTSARLQPDRRTTCRTSISNILCAAKTYSRMVVWAYNTRSEHERAWARRNSSSSRCLHSSGCRNASNHIIQRFACSCCQNEHFVTHMEYSFTRFLL